jgi:predicted transcriptional regulator
MARPDDLATKLLFAPDTCSEGRTIVVDDGRLVGIISPSDISRLVQRSMLGGSQRPVPSA